MLPSAEAKIEEAKRTDIHPNTLNNAMTCPPTSSSLT